MTNTRELVANLLEVAECYSDGRETYEPFEQILREARSYLNNEKSVMAKNYPITPPPELVQQWAVEWTNAPNSSTQSRQYIATRAAQWGADQELEACCEWVKGRDWTWTPADLRAARRPKPPSLKQQALETLKYPKDLWSEAEVETIRRALEALPDD
jgi:hypothetical protein